MIFVSTGGRRQNTGAETALDFYGSGIQNVELSGGAPSLDFKKELMALPKKIALQVHNYFPPPVNPFVLNLASTDPVVAEKSIHHIKEAICLATMLGRPTYSFHAGFRINPQVCELGNKLSRYALVNRETSFGLFGERVLNLAEDARREGATLLIENNVINKRNLSVYGEDPLLLTHPDEIAKFMVGMPENVGLLLDVAHLKVSSGALNFNLEDAHETLKRWIKGYHLSDNNGEFDSNECVHTDSWFWDLLVSGLDYYSLEVYNTSTAKLYEQYKYTEMRLAKNMSSPKMMD